MQSLPFFAQSILQSVPQAVESFAQVFAPTPQHLSVLQAAALVLQASLQHEQQALPSLAQAVLSVLQQLTHLHSAPAVAQESLQQEQQTVVESLQQALVSDAFLGVQERIPTAINAVNDKNIIAFFMIFCFKYLIME